MSNLDQKTVASFGDEWFRFDQSGMDSPGLAPESQDFGDSIDVLNHVRHTAIAIRDCVRLLKPGALQFLYLYYAFDQRPAWFRAWWRLSGLLRRFIYCLPAPVKHALTDLIGLALYWPLSRAVGLHDIRFSNEPPCWCAVGVKG